MAKTSAIKEGIPGKICGGIRKRKIQSTDIATTISRIALDMGAWQGKKIQELTTCQWEKIYHMNRTRDKKKDSKSEEP